MSFFDFIKPQAPANNANNNNQQQAPANNQQAPVNGQQQQQQQQPASNLPSANPGNPNGTNTQPNPLDIYTQVFNNSNKGNEQTPPSFSLPEDTLNQVSSSLDFTKSVPAELLQKALSGDANALLQAMNVVGQQAYKTSLSHTTSLTDKFVGARSQYDLQSVGSQVKSELTAQELSNLPSATHPLIKQELGRIAKQLAQSNPDAPPAEIARAAEQYFKDLYAGMNPAKPQDSAKAGDTDWDTFFK